MIQSIGLPRPEALMITLAHFNGALLKENVHDHGYLLCSASA
jgi:hypothetical protein